MTTAKPYLLLTGATGLLGEYLLAELLEAGHRVVTVARASRYATPSERIDHLLARWERRRGYALPRPVVLAGDLSQPELGLSSDDRSWLSRHCGAALHNAASLTFVAKDRGQEPWVTNVDGTRHLLELCRAASIRTLHHVSTAYVCGLRQGMVRETELSVGQKFGNDYEQSKLESEQLVRGADFLESLTVYRPSIIVGDSRTGYSATFHGFYLPLKIAHALSSEISPEEMEFESSFEWFGLTGSEEKNFIPVEWVAAAMLRILEDARLHEQTYHLTPVERTPLSKMAASMSRMLIAQARRQRASAVPHDAAYYESFVREQMSVYQAYWRDDPQFDRTHTEAAVGDLPCPVLDDATLDRLCRFAIQNQFTAPAARGGNGLNLHAVLSAGTERLSANDQTATTIGLQINGQGGGSWSLKWDQRGARLESGLTADCGPQVYANTQTIKQLLAGQLTIATAQQTGQVLVTGGQTARPQACRAFQQLFSPAGCVT